MLQRLFSTVSVAALLIPASLQAYELCVDAHAALVKPVGPHFALERMSPEKDLVTNPMLAALASEYGTRRNPSPERHSLSLQDPHFDRLLDETLASVAKRMGEGDQETRVSLSRILDLENSLPNDELSRGRQLSDLVELHRLHEREGDGMNARQLEEMAALEMRLPRWVKDSGVQSEMWARIDTLKNGKLAADHLEAVRLLGMLDVKENQRAQDELMALAADSKFVSVRTAARQELLAHGLKAPLDAGELPKTFFGKDWHRKRDELARLDDETFIKFIRDRAPASFLRNHDAARLLESRDERFTRELLRRRDPDYRYFALGGLAGRYDEVSLALLEKAALQDGDVGVRRRAVEILTSRSDWGAIAAAQRIALKAPELVAKVRERLADRATPSGAMNPLEIANLLSDPDPAVRRTVIGHLEGQLNFTLREAVRSPDLDIRLAAIDAALKKDLARPPGTSPEEVIALAEVALKSRDEATVLATLDALQMVGGLKAKNLIESMRSSANHLIADRANKNLVRPDLSIQLLDADPTAIKAFEPSRHWSNDQIAAELDAPDELRQMAATEQLFGRPTELIAKALKSQSPRVRMHGVDALDGRTDKEAVELLGQALRDPVADVRMEAINALNWIHSEEADRLMEQALSDPNPRVSEHALGKILADSHLRSGRASVRHAEFVQKLEQQRLQQLRAEDKNADKQQMALDFANHVYNAPRRENWATAEAMVRQEEEFRRTAPTGYKVDLVYHDPRTGLAYCYYKPQEHMRGRPNVFAIAGTRGAKDVAADMQLGLPQGESGALRDMLAEIAQDLRAGEDVTLTGHSLGGGLAQIFSYYLQREIQGAEQPGTVSRSTINAFGAKEILMKQLKSRGETYDPAVAQMIRGADFVHYRDNNGKKQFDLVARLGTHVGGELLGIEKQGAGGLHGLRSVQSSMSEGGAKEAEPVTVNKIPFVTGFLASKANVLGSLANLYLKTQFKLTWKNSLETMCQARERWMEQTGYQDLRPLNDKRTWLSLEIREVLAHLSAADQVKAQAMVDASNARIEQTLRRKQALEATATERYVFQADKKRAPVRTLATEPDEAPVFVPVDDETPPRAAPRQPAVPVVMPSRPPLWAPAGAY